MKTATLLLALVASANADSVTLSPGAAYNLDYTTDTSGNGFTVSTDLSGYIKTIKLQLDGGDFTNAYSTYTTNIQSLVNTASSSAALTQFTNENNDAGSTFTLQVTKYLSEVEVRLMNKP